MNFPGKIHQQRQKIKKDIRIEKFIIKKVIKHKLISDGDDFQIMINPTYDLRW